MRKYLALIMVLCLVCVALTACGSQANEPNEPAKIKEIPQNNEGMSLYWQSGALSLFSPDPDARIKIYTDAGKYTDGSFAWQDGHEWLVRLESSVGEFYLLPRQWVQMGDVSCTVYFADEGGEWNLRALITIKQGAGIEIYEHVYNKETNEFDKERIFSTKELENVTVVS